MEVPTVAAASQQFYVEDIKAAMLGYIDAQVDADGVFHMRDDKTGEMLALKFVKIHDPVRQIDGDTYFACTDFHVDGDPEKLYDLDFWMNARTGHLAVYDSKVHKEPRRSIALRLVQAAEIYVRRRSRRIAVLTVTPIVSTHGHQ